jgi:hypothetical protein
MARKGTFLDRSTSHVYEKEVRSFLGLLGVDVSEDNLISKSKWTTEDKAVAKKALTVVLTPCIKCGAEMPMFFQDVGFVWCGDCSK